jgi:hypothetical protein
MISTSFTTIACAVAVALSLIHFGRHLGGSTTNKRHHAIVISVLTAAALLHMLRPNAPCVRLDENRLASLR